MMISKLKEFPEIKLIKKWFLENKNNLSYTTCNNDQSITVELFNRGQFDDCFCLCISILAREPKREIIWNTLGVLYRQWKNNKAAEFCYQQAIKINPKYVSPYSNLSFLYTDLKNYQSAIEYAKTAVKIQPNFADAWNNMGNALQRIGEMEDAIDCFEKVLSINPNHLKAFNNYLLSIQYASNKTADEIAEAHRVFGEKFCKIFGERNKTWPNIIDQNRKLRVGYISPDLRDHSVSYFFEPLLANHNHKDFHIICYDNKGQKDNVNQRLRHLADEWYETVLWSDDYLVEKILEDQLDILIDLAGHTAGNRLSIFAYRAAPIQVTWLGHPNTSGLPTMDWRLTDWVADPVNIDYRYSERLWRLPEVFCAYRPCIRYPEIRHTPEFQTQPTPALKNGFITFGSLNNIGKLSQKVIEIWSTILLSVQNSKLLLEVVDLEGSTSRRILSQFASYGIDEKKLILLERDVKKQYIRYHEIDICLDPFPTNGGTTTCDILWFGVPIVVLEGDSFVSRMGTTFLNAIGKKDWLCKNHQEYIEKALYMASDIDRLNYWRLNLRQATEASALMNEKAFTEQVEIAYRTMWILWCEKQLNINQLPVDIDTAAREQARQAFKKGYFAPLHVLCDKTLEKIPEDLYANGNKAVLYVREGNPEKAIPLYIKCLEKSPENPDLYNNLAAAYIEIRDWQNAYKSAKKAVELSPQLVNAWISLAASACYSGLLIEAENAARTAVSLNPNDIKSYGNLSAALTAQGRLQESLAISRLILEKWPDNHESYTSTLFGMLYDENSDVMDAVKIAKLFSKNCESKKKIKWPRSYPTSLDPFKKIKLGFISPDFNSHAVMYFFEPILFNINRNKFEIYCYYTYSGGDAVTDRIHSASDKFSYLANKSPEEQASIIFNDGIDVLIDLAGHTGRNGLQTVAYHPAPVQITWLGYPGTTGLESIQWRITDKIADPVGVDDQYTENLIRLPVPFCVYRPLIKKPELRYYSDYDVKPTPALKNGFVTFGCCNNISKLTDRTLKTWGKLLSQVNNSKLLIEGNGLNVDAIARQFADRCESLGIDKEKLILVGRNSANQYLTYHNIDIALDPFPLTGGTTTFDLLWMGVPLVSMEGHSFRGRLSTSILYFLNKKEWLAKSEDEYIEIATSLAENLERLNLQRMQQRLEMEKSDLMNEKKFTNFFSDAVRLTWFDFCAEKLSISQKESLIGNWLGKINSEKKYELPKVFIKQGESITHQEAIEKLQHLLINARLKQPKDSEIPLGTTLAHWVNLKVLAEKILLSFPFDQSALVAMMEYECAHGRYKFASNFCNHIHLEDEYIEKIREKINNILSNN